MAVSGAAQISAQSSPLDQDLDIRSTFFFFCPPRACADYPSRTAAAAPPVQGYDEWVTRSRPRGSFPCPYHGGTRCVLLGPGLRDAADQRIRNALGQRELQIALRPGVACDLFPQLGVAHRRVHADVLLECSEVDHVAVERERRYPVADLLLRFRYGLRDRGPDLLQDRLDVRRKGCDVLVDARAHPSSSFMHSLR